MNKNTRNLNRQIRLARRANLPEITVMVPVHDYHNHDNTTTRPRVIPVYQGGGVVSQNERRNMCMMVETNPGDSRTFHVPLIKGRFTDAKGHAYLKDEYKQFVN